MAAWSPPLLLAGAATALAIEGFLLDRAVRLARIFRDAMETCARSLPVVPLKPAAERRAGAARSHFDGALEGGPR